MVRIKIIGCSEPERPPGSPSGTRLNLVNECQTGEGPCKEETLAAPFRGSSQDRRAGTRTSPDGFSRRHASATAAFLGRPGDTSPGFV